MNTFQEQTIEISHDILAKKVYDRVDGEEKMRMKITYMVEDRFTYFQETGILIPKKQFAYITPYLNQIEVGQEERAFLEKSHQAIRRKKKVTVAIRVSIIAFLLIFLVFAIRQWQKAIDAPKIAVPFVLEDAEVDMQKLRFEEALSKCQDAYELNNNEESDTLSLLSQELIELAYFYWESTKRDTALSLIEKAASLYNPSDSVKKSMNEELEKAFAAGKQQRWSKCKSHFMKVLVMMNRPWLNQLSGLFYPEMLPIEGAKFIMGGEWEAYHTDSILVDDFFMASTEITFLQYALYCEATGKDSIKRIKPHVDWGTNGDNPVVYVSWKEAAQYANWLSEKQRKTPVYEFRGSRVDIDPTANGFRLPTEAEWEYAANGGKNAMNTRFSGSNDVEEVAWFSENSKSRTQKVKSKKANVLGLYDMSGNVGEWCQNSYQAPSNKRYARPSAHFASSGRYQRRAVRGGWWNGSENMLRITDRAFVRQDARDFGIGFRLVLSNN